ncbi:MAG: gluconate 2-dehydrogenase subunit 3 family protein [Desulfotomaculaceae bacterium]|nr:gluconate 2-dehydrogenase subunit 3 family protein [Desulfotomaculaceae bacterium]
MQENRTRYPGYDILKEKEHWDDHTHEIVLKRLGPFPKHKFLNDYEAKMILAIAQHIVYDNRKEILDYVLHHIDNALSSTIGEDQRKVGTPVQKVLVREGLKAIDKLAKKQYKSSYLESDVQQQLSILAALQKGKAAKMDEWQTIPQKELFKKLATQITSAYYSHPTVWSEIGYGGPAYPRGYVRVERGLTDPWEAKRDANES